MVTDVDADSIDQLARGGDGEAPPKRHEADPRGEGVHFFLALAARKEGPVEQRNGDDAVQFETFELPRAGHPGGDHAYGYGGDEIEEDGEPEGDQHYQEVLPLNAVEAGDEPPIYDVPADLHEYAGKDGVGDRLDVFAEAEDQGQQDCRAEYSRDRCPPARADVYDRAEGGPGAGQSPYEARGNVADALPHELPVRFVAGTGHSVCYQGGEQTVDGA